ncbi:MAG TPA: MFS transporter [Ideonella sp.]|nr:MFS transporter [Ideonella sp.]
MYAFDRGRLAGLRSLRGRPGTGVAPNVLFLGTTSLLTDLSSEMVASILPIYLVFSLALSPLQFGLVDGLYKGAAALAGLAGGLWADRWRRHRDVAAAGYGLSALCKLGLLAAGNAWGLIAATIALDRVGKGLRTAPRDALISLSSPPQQVGLAFGVHRALDTAGALLGPLAAFAILSTLPDAYDVVFVTSFFVAVVGLSVLLLFVRNPAALPRAVAAAAPPVARTLRELLAQRRFRALLLAGMALALVAVPDSFLYLLIQQRAAIPASHFPLLPVATAVGFLLLAIPAGRLGDRIGRAKVFLLGYGVLLAACAALLLVASAAWGGFVALALLGVHFACTDGVLMATASGLLPAHQRASGLALLVTAIGVCRLLASVLFGAAWQHWGMAPALLASALALAGVTLAVALGLLRGRAA